MCLGQFLGINYHLQPLFAQLAAGHDTKFMRIIKVFLPAGGGCPCNDFNYESPLLDAFVDIAPRGFFLA